MAGGGSYDRPDAGRGTPPPPPATDFAGARRAAEAGTHLRHEPDRGPLLSRPRWVAAGGAALLAAGVLLLLLLLSGGTGLGRRSAVLGVGGGLLAAWGAFQLLGAGTRWLALRSASLERKVVQVSEGAESGRFWYGTRNWPRAHLLLEDGGSLEITAFPGSWKGLERGAFGVAYIVRDVLVEFRRL